MGRLACSLACLVALLAGAARAAGAPGPEWIGHDPTGDVRHIGNYNLWPFIDIVEFGGRDAARGFEGFVRFAAAPLACPYCVFTITFTERSRTLAAEIVTTFTRFRRLKLVDGYDSKRERTLNVRFPVRQVGTRLEFFLPVRFPPGTVMRVESFHDEGAAGGGKAFDLTERPLVLGGRRA